jgi:diguanylate cyclase (GGDEF)-like protein
MDAAFRLIVIDDNPSIHEDYKKVLNTNGVDNEITSMEEVLFDKNSSEEKQEFPTFKIDSAMQGEEGVKKIKGAAASGNPYALAFVDIRMPPGWDGLKTIRNIWKVDPNIQCVICTAYSDYTWEETISQLGMGDNFLILRKPFEAIIVRQIACALVKKWKLSQITRQYTARLESQLAEQNAELKKSVSLMRATLESTGEGVLTIDNDGKLINYNKKFALMWELPEKELNASGDAKYVFGALSSLLENPKDFLSTASALHYKGSSTYTDTLKLKDGRFFECRAQLQEISEKASGAVWCFRDITRQKILEEQLQHQATHDVLTGLPNRTLLIEHLHQQVANSRRNRNLFSVFFLDLDRFKVINDNLTHAIGDVLLKAVANRLQTILRANDFIARLGGDEFVLVTTGINTREDVTVVSKRLLSGFEEEFFIEGRKFKTDVSIGVSMYPADGETANILLKNADIAMYAAKARGGNNLQFYSADMDVASLARLELEEQLRQALSNHEFVLHYQPQINIKTGELEAVEALVRWKHPTRGLIQPLEFISVVEEIGLLKPLGEWILRSVCAQNKAWQSAGFPPVRVSVNLVASQFETQNMVELIKKTLDETQLDPKYLEIELTESVFMKNMDISNTVRDIKSLGVHVALDDFGTGYTNLSFLKKLPLDRLKLDRSFVEDIKGPTQDNTIAHAIISMAKSLNLQVAAAGVETPNQVDFLKKEACNLLQGFYFSRPVPADEMIEIFKKK